MTRRTSQARFSIVMPAFNAEATIERAVRSVLAQETSGWELIVVDDCSTDRTADLVAALAQNAVGVRLIRHDENRGVAAARNSGIDAARGELISFVDSDDECLPSYLSTLSTGFEGEVDVVLGAREVIGGAEGVVTSSSSAIGTFTGDAAVRLAMLDRLSPFPWDKMFRRSLFDDIRFPEGLARFEDMVTNILLYSRARRVRSLTTPVYRYYVAASSLTWGRVPDAREGREAIDYVLNSVPPELIRGRALRSMRTLMTLLIAQSAIARGRGSQQQDRVVSECRDSISLRDLVATLTSAPRVGLAAVLLKWSPTTYAKLYRRYIRRAFGLVPIVGDRP